MKIGLVLALAASLAISGAVLPPGYEDQIWCPPGDCQIYTNPFGLTGAQSSFIFCYNADSGNITDGVWTGSLTDVEPPHGWVEPDNCTAEEYSECDVDDDCIATVRTMTPLDGWGQLCVCFADSFYHPFDQCEGRDSSNCLQAKCSSDPCKGYQAICGAGFDGAGACTISGDSSRSGDDDDSVDDDDWKRTKRPTRRPTRKPTRKPTKKPTRRPTRKPTRKPSPAPTKLESPAPTQEPVTPAPVPALTPAPVPSGPVTPMPVHISMPMEDLLSRAKKQVYMRGDASQDSGDHEYYDGHEYDSEENYEFGRVTAIKTYRKTLVKAIA